MNLALRGALLLNDLNRVFIQLQGKACLFFITSLSAVLASFKESYNLTEYLFLPQYFPERYMQASREKEVQGVSKFLKFA